MVVVVVNEGGEGDNSFVVNIIRTSFSLTIFTYILPKKKKKKEKGKKSFQWNEGVGATFFLPPSLPV